MVAVFIVGGETSTCNSNIDLQAGNFDSDFGLQRDRR